MRIILASQSPRRKELLKMVVPEFDVIVSKADESLEDGLKTSEQASSISYLKAKTVFDETTGDRIVIGSDTMVVKNEKIYGKPKSRENAKEILKELLIGDRTHTVVTGLCVLVQKGDEYKEYITFDEAKVCFKEMSDVEIEKWIDTGKAMDKAGAYSLQDEFGRHIEKIDGNFFTVIGLPVHKLYDILKNDQLV